MIDALEVADQSVIDGLEPFEVTYAKNQPEYRPLRALKSMKDDGAILTRWTFTPEQRQAIADGADLFLEVLTFFQSLQPVLLFVGDPTREEILERFGLTDFTSDHTNTQET